MVLSYMWLNRIRVRQPENEKINLRGPLMNSPNPKQPYAGLYCLRGEGNNLTGFTLLLKREAGNFIIYNGGTLAEIVDEVTELGGAAGIFINDRHNAKQTDVITELCQHFGAPLYASTIEAKVPAIRLCLSLSALPFQSATMGADFDIIPLPGHTAGNFAYLCTTPENRILFIGDTLVHQRGEWNFWVSKPNCRTLARGLEELAARDFDVIVSTSFGCKGGNIFSVTPNEKSALFGEVISRLERKAGGAA